MTTYNNPKTFGEAASQLVKALKDQDDLELARLVDGGKRAVEALDIAHISSSIGDLTAEAIAKHADICISADAVAEIDVLQIQHLLFGASNAVSYPEPS